MNSIDFTTGFNSLMGILPADAKIVLAIVGSGIVVFALLRYFWQRRKGNGGARIPWGMFIEILMQIVPAEAKIVLAIVGSGIVVFALLRYFWQRRKGSGGARIPWMMFNIGAALARPLVTIPLFLNALQIIVGFFVIALNWVLGFFK